VGQIPGSWSRAIEKHFQKNSLSLTKRKTIETRSENENFEENIRNANQGENQLP
jgi:hypothetical protein